MFNEKKSFLILKGFKIKYFWGGLIFIFALFFSSQTQASFVYWTDITTNKLQRANLDGSNVEDILTTGLSSARDVAVYAAGGKVFIANLLNGSIDSVNLDGSNHVNIITGLTKPNGVAVDLTNEKIYYTEEGGTAKVGRADLDGSNNETLVSGGSSNQGIALDIPNSHMYWTSQTSGQLKRANTDGTDIINVIGINNATGIDLDLSAGKIYYVDPGAGNIQRSTLTGANNEVLVTDLGLHIEVDVSGGKMYWGSLATVARASLDGSNVENIVSGLGQARGIGLLLDNTTANGDMITAGGATITLATVSSSGITSLADADASEANSFLADPMVGAMIVSSILDITTTATVSGTHTLKFAYNEVDIPAGYTELDLKLFHNTGSSIVDITTSIDTVNNFIFWKTSPFINTIAVYPLIIFSQIIVD